MKIQSMTKNWFAIAVIVLIVVLVACLSGYVTWYTLVFCVLPFWRALTLLSRDREVKPGW